MENFLIQDEITDELFISIKGLIEYLDEPEFIVMTFINYYLYTLLYWEDIDIFYDRITIICFERLKCDYAKRGTCKKELREISKAYYARREKIANEMR
jgi:hypothetical protein